MKAKKTLDVWQIISFVILALYALFLVLPLGQLLLSSVVNDEGQFTSFFVKWKKGNVFLFITLKYSNYFTFNRSII